MDLLKELSKTKLDLMRIQITAKIIRENIERIESNGSYPINRENLEFYFNYIMDIIQETKHD